MSYYPNEPFSVDLDRIVRRAQSVVATNSDKSYVILKSGTVIPIPNTVTNKFELAKQILNQCRGRHPDFYVMEENGCTITIMNFGVATYLFDDEWDLVKGTVSRDKMMCEGEFLMNADESTLDKALYSRLRIFADGKNPELHQIV